MATKATKRTKTSRRQTSKRRSTGQSRDRQQDVIGLIKSDHAAVNQLFRRYQGLGDRATKSRRQIAERLIKELSVHAAVEEQVLYPNARAAVPNGEKLVKEAVGEHQSLKEALTSLDKTAPASDKFDRLMMQIRDDVRHHVKEEESPNGLLSQLRKHSSRDERVQMAKLTRAAKKAAPTRPHPKVPAGPPGNIVVGAAAAMVDKVRDQLAGRK